MSILLHTFLLCTLANLLRYRKTSVVMELDQLLSHVKETFSEILLPVESVTKLEILGKGTWLVSIQNITFLVHLSIGKFGVVHKGNLLTDDGNHKVVAIKTIKCKLCTFTMCQ